jgi:hypothetical protein
MSPFIGLTEAGEVAFPGKRGSEGNSDFSWSSGTGETWREEDSSKASTWCARVVPDDAPYHAFIAKVGIGFLF